MGNLESMLIDFNCSVTIVPKGFGLSKIYYSIHMFCGNTFFTQRKRYSILIHRTKRVCIQIGPRHIDTKEKRANFLSLSLFRLFGSFECVWVFIENSKPFISFVSNKSNGQLVHLLPPPTGHNVMQFQRNCVRTPSCVHRTVCTHMGAFLMRLNHFLFSSVE